MKLLTNAKHNLKYLYNVNDLLTVVHNGDITWYRLLTCLSSLIWSQKFFNDGDNHIMTCRANLVCVYGVTKVFLGKEKTQVQKRILFVKSYFSHFHGTNNHLLF